MFDDIDINSRIALWELLLHLHEYGFVEVHLGGLMRIVGVSNSIASRFDQDVLTVSQDFIDAINELLFVTDSANRPQHKSPVIH